MNKSYRVTGLLPISEVQYMFMSFHSAASKFIVVQTWICSEKQKLLGNQEFQKVVTKEKVNASNLLVC